MYTQYTGAGGYAYENERAAKVLSKGVPYRIVGGTLGRCHSTYELEGIEGEWNTCMFDVSWEQARHLLADGYLYSK